jgi:hypothetical protein
MHRDYAIYAINFFHPQGVQVAQYLERYLLDSVDILGYWNYIPLLYFVKTRLSATQLTEKLQGFLGSGIFIVAEVNPENINGRLPQPAWNWLYEPPTEPGNRKPPSAIPLSAILGLPPPKA